MSNPKTSMRDVGQSYPAPQNGFSYHAFGMTLDDPSADPSSIDSALFFVMGAFILNVIVVLVALCYFDPSSSKPPLLHRIFSSVKRTCTTTDKLASQTSVLFV